MKFSLFKYCGVNLEFPAFRLRLTLSVDQESFVGIPMKKSVYKAVVKTASSASVRIIVTVVGV